MYEPFYIRTTNTTEHNYGVTSALNYVNYNTHYSTIVHYIFDSTLSYKHATTFITLIKMNWKYIQFNEKSSYKENTEAM